MCLSLLAIGVFVHFLVQIHSKAPNWCQPITNQDRYPPRTRHQILDQEYLQNFEEILVIGDVHGCYDELQLLLKKANATSHNVLKIFVGDLVRKGPKSLEVLDYIRNSPSCLSVKGNNDQKCLLKHYRSLVSNKHKLSRQNEWMSNLSPADLEFIEDLPYTISIPSLNSIIVHAGLLPGVPLENQKPWTLMNIRDVIPDPYCPGGFRPSPKRSKGFPWASVWKGPQRVYFGHDAKRRLQLYHFATGLDTGCFRGDYLTGLFINGSRAGSFVIQNSLHPFKCSFP